MGYKRKSRKKYGKKGRKNLSRKILIPRGGIRL